MPPATQAAVASVSPAEQPLVTRPHSAPVSTARRAPTASASSSRCTYFRAAASIAARTSGSIVEPLMMVKVPRALMSGRTPIDVIDVRARLKPGRGRRSGRWSAGSLALAEDGARHRQQTAEHAAAADQLTPADGLAHRGGLLGSCVTMPHAMAGVKTTGSGLRVSGKTLMRARRSAEP